MKKLLTTLVAMLLLFMLTACSNIAGDSEYLSPEGTSYKYKLELTGTVPNSEKESTFIILTNDNKLTFDKVSKSLFSSNSKDSKNIDFYLLSLE